MFIQYWFLLPGALGGVTRNVPVLSGGRKKKAVCPHLFFVT